MNDGGQCGSVRGAADTGVLAVSAGLVSFSLLALQLFLMQALAWSQGHHLAYVVISLALLGFGASGAMLCWGRARFGLRARLVAAPALWACAAALVVLVPLARPLLAGFTLDLLGTDAGQWARLFGIGALLFLPFFCGALALGAMFTARAERIGPLYAANLAGSAAGAAGALLLLHFALPETLIPLLVVPAGLAAILAMEAGRGRRFGLGGLALLGLLALGWMLPRDLPLSQYKGLSHALLLPEVRMGVKGNPHPLGRVHEVWSDSMHHAPDLSLRYTGPVPTPGVVFVNGEARARLADPSGAAAEAMAHTPMALPLVLRDEGAVVWMLGAGGMPLAEAALARGAKVILVEPHLLVSMSLQKGVVPPIPVESRRDFRGFLDEVGTVREPNVIVFPDAGMFGGPVGLQALGEDFLFTCEGVRAAFGRLAPGGHVAFPVWIDEPARHAPRLVALVAEAMREEGFDPAAQVIAIRGWGAMVLVAGIEPVEEDTLMQAREFTEQMGFDLLWPVAADVAGRLHGTSDDAIDRALAACFGSEESAREFVDAYRFDISPPRDDRPFFNQFLRVRDAAGQLSGADGDFAALSLSERGLVIVTGVLGVLVLAVVGLIVLPLAARPRDGAEGGLVGRGGQGWFTLLFFGGIGAGFMFFEIAMIQRFTLLWGSALFSVAGVISALLVGMGVGSMLSRKWEPSRGRIGALVAGLVVLQIALALWGGPLFRGLSSVSWIAGLLFLVLLSVPLGMPFPLAVRRLAGAAPAHVPWAWGINGGCSVLGATTAGLIALAYGYTVLMLAGAAAYLVAALGAGAWRERRQREC